MKKPKIAWHQIFARLLEEVLSPVDISVLTEVSVMSNPPQADILLLTRQQTTWTEAQRQRLPDGIRQSKASHVLLEFKYTESVTKETLIQAVAYDYFYKQSKQLSAKEVQTFIISAKQPHKNTLNKLGYEATKLKGVSYS